MRRAGITESDVWCTLRAQAHFASAFVHCIIVGHASIGYEAMEILYHTSCRCAKRMERALIDRVRNNHVIRYRCRNKSAGGEGMSGNAPIYFVYVAYTLVPPETRTPNFSRWEPSP